MSWNAVFIIDVRLSVLSDIYIYACWINPTETLCILPIFEVKLKYNIYHITMILHMVPLEYVYMYS